MTDPVKDSADAAMSDARATLMAALESDGGKALVMMASTPIKGLVLLIGGLLTEAMDIIIREATVGECKVFLVFLEGTTEVLNAHCTHAEGETSLSDLPEWD
jgi:hypothetical protein